MTIEKRIEAREPVRLPLTLADGSAGTTRDVSVTGLFFEMDSQLEQGGEIDFTIELSANGRPMWLKACGQVVRIESCGERIGVAVKIIEAVLQAEK